MEAGQTHSSGIVRAVLFIVGALFAAIGIVGVLIPILPGLPFLLVAAVCWARASSRMHAWLVSRRFFDANAEVSPAARRVLLGTIIVSYCLAIVLFAKTLLAKFLVAGLAIVAVFGVTRLSERKRRRGAVSATWREAEG